MKLSTTDTALNDVSAKSHHQLPWRLRGDYENILACQSSIKLPFLKSTHLIEEQTLKQNRGIIQDEGQHEGERIDSVPSRVIEEERLRQVRRIIQENGEGGYFEGEDEDDDFALNKNENSSIFPRSVRKVYGREKSNTPVNITAEKETNYQLSALAHFSKESSQQQNNQLEND